MTTQQNAPLSAAEQERRSKQWTQAEYAKALTYLQNKGLGQGQVQQSVSRILPPFVALWRFEVVIDHKRTGLWVITGDVPHDHVPVSAAASAREALRHFSMNWQLKAANLEQGASNGNIVVGTREQQLAFAQELQTKAAAIYDLTQADRLWPNEA